MFRYVLKRLLYFIPTLIGISIVIFVLMSITPGDPVKLRLGENYTQEAYLEMQKEMGLDKPLVIQFVNYMSGIVRGDFGKSYRNDLPVLNEILARLPTTLRLATLSIICATGLGITTGVISAVKQYTLVDNITTAIALFGVSAPAFWLALMLVLVFSVNLGWLPSSGTYGWEYWILPVLTLSLQHGATIMRFTRTSMLDVIRQDYIQTARAKGQKEIVIVINHALRNAMIPIVTILGVSLCTLLAGSMLTETVFSIPGLGKFIIDSVSYRDRPSVQGTMLFVGIMCSTVSLAVDLLYGYIDPRVKTLYAKKKKKGAE